MGVLRKNRRKLVYKDTIYFWYVRKDDDFDRPILHIISEDKRLILAYPIKPIKPYIVHKGQIFQGKKTDGCWSRYLVPFKGVDIITPQFVIQLISFAMEGAEAEKLLPNGKEIWY